MLMDYAHVIIVNKKENLYDPLNQPRSNPRVDCIEYAHNDVCCEALQDNKKH